MDKILVFGHGYLGSYIQNHFGCFVSTSRIKTVDGVRDALAQFQPDVVINAMGKTGKPNVDWCESHKWETTESNILLPLMMASVCQEQGIYFVHLGSGCVYNDLTGREFTESDPPNFDGSFYSRSKARSEAVLNEFDILQVRIRMPIGVDFHQKNLIGKLVSYRRVINIPNSVTCIPDFLDILTELIRERKTGIYNTVNKGGITHSQILELYKEIIDPSFEYEVIDLDELYQHVVARRSNCVLSVEKLESEGIRVRPAVEAVRDCLVRMKEMNK